MVVQRMSRIVGGAERFDLKLFEHTTGGEFGLRQFFIGSFPNFFSGVRGKEQVNIETPFSFEMGPMVKGISERVRNGLCPGEVFFFGVYLTGNEFLGNSIGP